MSAQPFRDRYRTNLDLGHAGAAERSLWSEVLLTLINDTILGAPFEVGGSDQRLHETRTARRYFTKPNNRSLRDLCDLIGLDHVAVRDRMIAKIAEAPTPEELLEASRRQPKATLIHAGEELTLRQWAKRTGIPAASIGARIKMGWSVADALTTPVRHITRPAAGAQGQRPGVGSDFDASVGTGGGSAVQVPPNINFSECERRS